MGEFMFDIKDNENLFVVSRYCLARNDGVIYIDIHEHVSGDFKNKFIAVPSNIHRLSHKKYRAMAATKEDALNKFLNIIKNSSLKDLSSVPH